MSARDDYPIELFQIDSEQAHRALLQCVHMHNEIDRLRAWKAEAMLVLAEWERVWEAAGCPGSLGSSKAESVRVLLSVSPASGPGGDRPTPTGQVTPNHNGDAA